jgi:hypothetical protein
MATPQITLGSVRRGLILLSVEKRSPGITNMSSIKTSAILMISVSENVFVESGWFYTK